MHVKASSGIDLQPTTRPRFLRAWWRACGLVVEVSQDLGFETASHVEAIEQVTLDRVLLYRTKSIVDTPSSLGG